MALSMKGVHPTLSTGRRRRRRAWRRRLGRRRLGRRGLGRGRARRRCCRVEQVKLHNKTGRGSVRTGRQERNKATDAPCEQQNLTWPASPRHGIVDTAAVDATAGVAARRVDARGGAVAADPGWFANISALIDVCAQWDGPECSGHSVCASYCGAVQTFGAQSPHTLDARSLDRCSPPQVSAHQKPSEYLR